MNLIIRQRQYGRFTVYKNSYKECTFCLLTEVPFKEIVEQSKTAFCIDTHEIVGLDRTYHPLNIFKMVNSETIRLLKCIKLDYIVTLLKNQESKETKLLRFCYNNTKYVTDGVSLMSYTAPIHDPRIMYTDKKSKYLMDDATVVDDIIIPMLILFMTNTNHNSDLEPCGYYDESIEQEYGGLPHYELISSLSQYYFDLTRDDKSKDKHKFFHILLCIALISNGRFSTTHINEVIEAITKGHVTLVDTMSFLMGGLELHNKQLTTSYGVQSYYTPFYSGTLV